MGTGQFLMPAIFPISSSISPSPAFPWFADPEIFECGHDVPNDTTHE